MATRKTLENKLDRIFSKYIRLRDSVDGELVKCVTCGKFGHIKSMHCGHFMSRRHRSTRWNEKNCSTQCPACNTFNQGEQYKHAIYLDKKWGEGTALEMVRLSQTSVKWSLHELEVLIEDYAKRLETLERTL